MRKKINWILGGLIALIAGCKVQQKVENPEVVTLYGVPYATYDISGKVVDQNNRPVPDASVIVKGYRNAAIADTLQTNKQGKFQIVTSNYPADAINIVVQSPNESYPTDSVQHTVEYRKEQSERGFYLGECEIETTITIQNDKK